MLVNTHEVQRIGNKEFDIYENKLTGKRGILSEHDIQPSSRRETRQGVKKLSIVRTNRKATRGRRIHFQEVKEIVDTKTVKHSRIVNGTRRIVTKKVNIVRPTGKIIKHVQETHSSIKRKESYLNVMADIELRAKKYDKSKKESND